MDPVEETTVTTELKANDAETANRAPEKKIELNTSENRSEGKKRKCYDSSEKTA
jgi:hypothetical protein